MACDYLNKQTKNTKNDHLHYNHNHLHSHVPIYLYLILPCFASAEFQIICEMKGGLLNCQKYFDCVLIVQSCEYA